MKRFFSVTILSFILATLVGAQGDRPRPTVYQQARMLEQNRDLLKVTVDKGLNLSSLEGGPLERAAVCTKLAGDWSKAIQVAATAKDTARVRELGGHFGKVVDKGVVANLRQARLKIPKDSLEEKKLEQRRDEALDVLKGLEDVLRGTQEFEPVMKTIVEGRENVQQAAKLEKR